MEAVAVMADRVKGVIDKLCCVREISTHSFLWYMHYSVQSLYAPFPFTKKYIAIPTRRAVFTRFFVKKSFFIF